MLQYDFELRGNRPLYQYLYECLKEDIQKGRLPAHTRLPSKRELARDNKISIKTVMNAYEQLSVEGYITSKEKKGYFVAPIERMPQYRPEPLTYPPIYVEKQWFVDFTTNQVVYDKFPFSMWKKVMREVLSQYETELVQRAHFLGVKELREAIADYLYRTRGMKVSPECMVIGASIEYLYGRLIKLLPRNAVYAVENPGYKKIPRIYEEFNLSWVYVDMDSQGISMESLRKTGANILHISPEHHYPLGTVMSAARRQELLLWAGEEPDRYLIEDDYDCEFRYHSRSISPLQSMDRNHRIIYMNTFSKTLAPSIRISYMILPEKLMVRYVNESNFYSNTASSCEQYALAKFIREGYFERHLSRMKKYYQAKGELLMRILKQSSLLPTISINGGKSGTHLLLKVDTSLTDTEIKWGASQQNILIACLSEFCGEIKEEYRHTLVLNYSDMEEKDIREAVRRLGNIFVEW